MIHVSDIPMDDLYDIINSINYDGTELLVIRNKGNFSNVKNYYLSFYDNGYANNWVVIPIYDREYQDLLNCGFKKEEVLASIAMHEGARTYNSVGFINRENKTETRQI